MSNDDAARRNRDWRARKREAQGGLTQIITWIPIVYSEQLRTIFNLLGDPDWRGSASRAEVAHWRYRRRPAPHRTAGTDHIAEIDPPHVGPELIPIGGRVFGSDGTFVELNPTEADTLKRDLQNAAEAAIEHFLVVHKLTNLVRDNTGVVTDETFLQGVLSQPAHKKEVARPREDKDFAANESAIIRSVATVADKIEITRIDDKLFEMRYPGKPDKSGKPDKLNPNVPGRCLAVVCPPDESDKTSVINLALIGLPNGGTPPNVVFEQLAQSIIDGDFKHNFVPAGSEATVRWFNVEPDDFFLAGGLRISEVRMVVDVKAKKQKKTKPVFEPDPLLPSGYVDFFKKEIGRATKLKVS